MQETLGSKEPSDARAHESKVAIPEERHHPRLKSTHGPGVSDSQSKSLIQMGLGGERGPVQATQSERGLEDGVSCSSDSGLVPTRSRRGFGRVN